MSNQSQSPSFTIGNREIGHDFQTLFIADIGANHDGDLDRALRLIDQAHAAGAEAVKFQHFTAKTIVSQRGFDIVGPTAHQKDWIKPVYEVYQDATINLNWTSILSQHCKELDVIFMSTPYDFALCDHLDPYVKCYKVGSGDINWIDLLAHIASKNKPIFLSTGASTLQDVVNAHDAISFSQQGICILLCNTDYAGSLDIYRHINLRVLQTYAECFPRAVLGLSDHTSTLTTALGAVALGARVIEKHFTDDNNRVGPDHGFAITAKSWREMVERTRELELSLGLNEKIVEDNEKSSFIVQRRSICASRDLKKGTILSLSDLEVLRPCPPGAAPPSALSLLHGQKLDRDILSGEPILLSDLIA